MSGKTTLREAFDQHRGRLVAKVDRFFDDYEMHLGRFTQQPIKLLEIGVDRGGSLELWQSYFHPKSDIHGIDIDPRAAGRCPPRASVHIGSQADEAFLAQVASDFGPFDIVIDDGSHRMQDQIITFETLYPRMAARGLYICEDSFTSYWDEYGGGPRREGTFIEYAKQLIDALHADWRGDTVDESTRTFCRTTRSIHFYSGTTVIERAPGAPPRYVGRREDEAFALTIADLKAAAARQAPADQVEPQGQ